jgi:hypothetical protein
MKLLAWGLGGGASTYWLVFLAETRNKQVVVGAASMPSIAAAPFTLRVAACLRNYFFFLFWEDFFGMGLLTNFKELLDTLFVYLSFLFKILLVNSSESKTASNSGQKTA